jgi:hypothetical protein
VVVKVIVPPVIDVFLMELEVFTVVMIRPVEVLYLLIPLSPMSAVVMLLDVTVFNYRDVKTVTG